MDDPDFAADVIKTVFGRFVTAPPHVHVRRLGSGTWTGGQGSWMLLVEGVAELHANGGIFWAVHDKRRERAKDLRHAITLVMGAYIGIRLSEAVYDEIESRKPE